MVLQELYVKYIRNKEVIMNKYPVETAMHNSVNPVMPRSIQENADNCITFLSELYTAKTVSITKEILKLKSKDV